MIFSVKSLSQDAMEACRYRIDHLTKPHHSLAQLESMAERLAGILDDPKPGQVPFAMLVIGGEEALDEEQSFLVYEKFQKIIAPTKASAKLVGAPVMLLNVGDEKMEVELVEEYLETGRSIAMQLQEQGIRVLGLGNIPSKAEEACYSLVDVVLEKGKLELEAWLEQLGETTPLLVTLVGVILGAAELRMGVFFDNEVTGLAAVLATAYVPMVKEYLFASVHYGTEVQAKELQYLGKEAPLHFGFTWAAGLGSSMGLSTLRAALHMLNDMKTFEEAGVTVAEDGPGSSAQQ